jgi:hypothetical protein
MSTYCTRDTLGLKTQNVLSRDFFKKQKVYVGTYEIQFRQKISWLYAKARKPGTDVMIFKIFSPKIFATKLAFLTQNKAKY